MSIKGFIIYGNTVKYNYPDTDNKPSIPVVDATLSQQGEAADAKATGDAIRSVSIQYSELLGNKKFVSGFDIASSGKWNALSGYSFYLCPVIPNDTLAFKTASSASFYTFLKSYSDPVSGTTPDYATGYTKTVSASGKFTVTVPSDAKYLVIYNVRNNANILPLWINSKNFNYLLSNAENHNNAASKTIEITAWPTSGYISTSGALTTGGTWVTTNYYPAKTIQEIYIQAYQIPGTVAIASFYDSNKNFVYAIDTVAGTSGNGIKDGYLTLTSVPATAAYVRFSTNSTSHYVNVKYDIATIAVEANVNASEAYNNMIDSFVKITSFNSDGYVNLSGSISSGSNWTYTDYMSAENVTSIASKAYQLPGTVALVAFYDANKTFISAVDKYDGQTGNGIKSGTIAVSSIPNGAVFMRFSSYTSITDKYVDVKYNYSATFPKLVVKVPELNARANTLETFTNRLYGYPFSMAFIGDSLTYGQTYIAAQGTSNYAYKNKANYPDVFCRMLGITTKTIIAIPGANPTDVWGSKQSEISAISNQFVIVWLGTNSGLTDTVATDCVGDDVSNYANTNTGNYGKIIQTLLSHGNKVFLAQLCYTSVIPVSNTAIQSLATRFGCAVLALTADDISDLNQDKYHTAYNGYVNSVHFNSVGYNHVATLFFSKMMSVVFENPEDYEIFMEDT